MHIGHVETVASLKTDLAIDEIRWVLSAQPPHKDQPSTTVAQRMAMLELVLDEYPDMISDDIEVRRDQASYTIDTLLHFRQEFPDANILLIVGSDIMASFHHWHRFDEILDVANLIVMHRAGYNIEVNSVLKDFVVDDWSTVHDSLHGNVFVYAAPPVPISSTQIRQAIALAENMDELLHPKVTNYIQQNQLYGFAQSPLKSIANQEVNMIENYAHTDVSTESVHFNSEQQVEMIVDALEDNKALDIKVLNISEVANFADYMVIATGTSNTHLQAVSGNTVRELSRQGLKALGEEGRDSNEWVLADFGDVVVHIMRQEVRELYDLEKLWDPDVRKALAEVQ